MNEERLKYREKFAFALGELPNAMTSILAAFLTMFYTDSIGMSAAAVGTMFFVSKIFDGITDILAGRLIDKTRTKWGKARPWLLWLSVPTGLSLALIFFIPSNGSPTTQLIYAFVTYNLYTSILFTVVGCAKNALMALMTQNADDRVSLSKYNTLFGLGAVMVGCALTFPFVSKMGGDTAAWRTVFIVYGIIITLGLLFAFTNSKEHVQAVENIQSDKATTMSFGESLKNFFSNKYFIFAMAINVLVNFSVQINSASQTYFYVYSMENVSLTTTMNLVTLIPMVISVVVLPNICIHKLGKKKSIYLGASIQIIASVVVAIASALHNVPALAVAMIAKNLAVGPLSIPVGILAADAVDYGEYKTNKRIEGMGTAVISFSQKVSSGLAAGCVGWVLGITGYVANQTQTAAAVQGINAMFCYMPAIAMVFVLILFKIFYHYDEEEEVVLKTLADRKQTAQK
ncbi:MAG: MFS transporter [Oliverpabstia sp.]